jgi:hypothetical protein
MKEFTLRNWHRRIGIILVLFIILQAGSGLIITISEIATPHEHDNSATSHSHQQQDEDESSFHETLEFLHHGGGIIGISYRILVGTGILWMAFTGLIIYVKIRTRS